MQYSRVFAKHPKLCIKTTSIKLGKRNALKTKLILAKFFGNH